MTACCPMWQCRPTIAPLSDAFRPTREFCHTTDGDRTRRQDAGVGTEPHGRTHVLDLALLGQEIDHGVRRVGVDLDGVRALEPCDVSRVFATGELHSETDPEEGNLVLPGELDGANLALDAA